MNPLDWLDYELVNIPVSTWAVSFGIFVGVFAVLALARRILRRRLDALSQRGDRPALKVAKHVVGRSKGWFLLLVSLFFASRGIAATLEIDTVDLWSQRIVVIGLLIQMGIWAVAGVGRSLELRRERQLEQDPGTVAAMDVVGFLLRVAVWSIVLLLALDNLGVNITALVAGLGVGGIAVALAAQSLLSDLFASLSIVLDKPFALGDFLVIGDLVGTVEKVGLKTTRIRALSGEELVVSNNDLLSSRIRNFGRMEERRIVFKLGVIYQTPYDKLKRIPKIIEDIIVEQENARFDRAHFQAYGDFSLNFEIVWYVETSDYRRYMDIQQSINLEIYRQFEEAGIEFAYPTQTLFLERGGDGG